MRKLSLLILGLLTAAPLALMATLWLMVEDRPRIDRKVILTPEHVGRAKDIIDRHRHSVRPGMLAVARVISADADLAANYLASRFGNGSAQLTVADRSAVIRLTLPMTATGLPAMSGYLNLEGTLVQTDGLPTLRSVRIGRLPLPNALAEVIALRFEDWLRRSPEYRSGFEALRQIKMSRNELTVVYRWLDNFPNEMRASIIDEHERARLLRYHSMLAASSAEHGGTISLGTTLSLLVRATHPAQSLEDAIADNRAIILVTTFHVLGITLEKLLPEAANWPRSRPQNVTLDGREDFAKHFIVSAAIAAFADTALADAIGLYKEIDDARYGSGFSFNDIAADRAGTKFGEKAVSNEDSAVDMRRRIASGLEDRDLMPKWDDLPEYLSEAEFKRRFTDIDSPAYRGTMEKIEQRVAGLRVLH
ncbi:hypothetical protein SAMN05216299_11152 [Nitrosospira sp. Nsp14]|uniref:hypothetical protein n=1 Tax=Nitrosospira sp. Nsp14 TaxID=1855333 RepID=UPI0008EC6D57|nr:hypothetical protein [Nitrosospira sp. Nsp14]SFH41244.1 hypothetical protein SAMN05216299_11152 [Nitrosospira sp. Nsp14]